MFALIKTSDNSVVAVTYNSPVFKEGYWFADDEKYSFLKGEASAQVKSSIQGVSPGDTLNGDGTVTKQTPPAPTPVPPPPPGDPRIWWMDQGPFIDRFDTYGYKGLKGLVLALGRTNDTIYAAFADMSIRKYIDIKGRRAELLSTLSAISSVIAALNRPAFTLSMQEAILDSPTTEAERSIKDLI